MLDNCRSDRHIHADDTLEDLDSCLIEVGNSLLRQFDSEWIDVSYSQIDLGFDTCMQFVIILINDFALRVARLFGRFNTRLELLDVVSLLLVQ